MKKLSISLLLLSVVGIMYSCKKSSSSFPGSTVTFTANGTAYTYKSDTGIVHNSYWGAWSCSSHDPQSSNSMLFVGDNTYDGTYQFSQSTYVRLYLNSKMYSTHGAFGPDGNGSITTHSDYSGQAATYSATFSGMFYNQASPYDSFAVTGGRISPN